MIAHFFSSPPVGAELVQGSYHFGLVVLSLFVAISLSLLSLRMTDLARRTQKKSFKNVIIFTGAIALGSGIWTMHFIGMFAFELPAPVSYNSRITVASMLPAGAAAWIALAMLTQVNITRKQLLVSGIIMGAGIGSMHYGGMMAIETPLFMRHDFVWFLLSVVVAVVLAMIAIGINFGLHRSSKTVRFWLSGITMGCAIAGMHYTAMNAVEFYGEASQADEGLLISTFHIALALSSVSLTIAAAVSAVSGQFFAQELSDKAAASKQRLIAIFDTAVDAIITMNSKGIIEEFSSSAEVMFGYTWSEAVGKNIQMLMPEAYRTRQAESLKNYFKSKKTKVLGLDSDVLGLRKDGTTFPMRLSIGEMSLGNGELLFVGLIADITEYKQLEESLRDAAERAQQAAVAKTNFLANMSHEIRTPMNAIIGFTELLLQSDLTQQQYNQMSTIRKSSRSLLGLLNDILDTSKLESGKFDMEIVHFSLKGLAEQIESTLILGARAKNLAFKVHYPESMPIYFQGDCLRILQVLTNLVGNAIKFTERGAVEVIFSYDDEQVHIQVKDTGIGMSEEQLHTVFDAFTQADASISRRFGGTGLGTTISRQLVDAMGGRIEIESELGVGSVFHVWLPLSLGEQHKAVDDEESNYEELPPLKILAADDIEQNRELLEALLLKHGHEITTVVNGQEAYDMATSRHFDLVLMDVHMPVVDGLQATRMIRAFEQGGNTRIPIVALTASVLNDDRVVAQEAGMDGFAVKPIDIAQLFKEIKRVVLGQGESSTVIEHEEAERTIDWARGISLWGSKHTLLEKIAGFLNEFASKYTFPKQPETAELEALKFNLHSLKGAAGNLGLMKLARITNELEQQLANENWSEFELGRQQLIEQVAAITSLVAENSLEKEDAPLAESPEMSANDSLALMRAVLEMLEHSEQDDSLLAQLADVPSSLKMDLEVIKSLIDNFEFEQAQELLSRTISNFEEQL